MQQVCCESVLDKLNLDFRTTSHSSNGGGKKLPVSLTDQTGPWLLESCGRCCEVQRSHGLPQFHQVKPSVPLRFRASGQRHGDATAAVGADSAVSAGQRVPKCSAQPGPVISFPAGTERHCN